MFLIDDLLLSPLKLVVWLGDKLNEVVDREVSDEGLIKEKLMHLQLQFELDEVTAEEYNRQEKELLACLEAIRKAKEKELE